MIAVAERAEDAKDDGAATQRLDKWLWFARVVKTRSLAARLVTDGRVRVNRVRTTKPAQAIKVDDVITVSVARGVRVLKVVSGGSRRGPASEAAMLYEEIVPLTSSASSDRPGPGRMDPADQAGGFVSDPGAGRPTKKDRRAIDRFRERYEE